MILFLDIRTAKSVMGIVGPRKADRLSSSGKSGIYALLKRADKAHGILTRKPTAVVVATGDRGGSASWSAVRTAVALGNSLAFAWGVPLAGLPLDGGETWDEVAVAVRRAAAKAKKNRWLRAAYDGEPNITVAKPVF